MKIVFGNLLNIIYIRRHRAIFVSQPAKERIRFPVAGWRVVFTFGASMPSLEAKASIEDNEDEVTSFSTINFYP